MLASQDLSRSHDSDLETSPLAPLLKERGKYYFKFFDKIFYIEDFIIGKSKNSNSLLFHFVVTILIVFFLVVMDSSINLDNNLHFMAIEISNICRKRMLSAEFQAKESSISE
jgi:hypothetical protein